MFIPLKDLNPSRRYSYINTALIIINVMVFIYQISLSPHVQHHFILANATVPSRFPAWFAGHGSFSTTFFPLFTSMFLHANLLHLGGNMLFLWIFGDNVEDFYGHFTYLLFYLVCGIGSGLFHVLFNFHSTVPTLGASGAISGVMGAYLLLYPRARILTLVFIFLLPVPAVVVLLMWFVLQFFSGVASLGMNDGAGVAWWAHVGGFVLGMVLTKLAKER